MLSPFPMIFRMENRSRTEPRERKEKLVHNLAELYHEDTITTRQSRRLRSLSLQMSLQHGSAIFTHGQLNGQKQRRLPEPRMTQTIFKTIRLENLKLRFHPRSFLDIPIYLDRIRF